MGLTRDVLELIQEYDGKTIRLTLDSALNGRLRFSPEDAANLIDEYFDKFKIEPNNFHIKYYFPNEEAWLIPRFLIPENIRPTGIKAKPLTVRMLLKSAKAGRWLYD